MKDRVLLRWWHRAAPSSSQLIGAILLAIVSALASLILLGGSGLLLARAGGGGGLAALGGLLILIELVAFFRAPLRLQERLRAHRIALASMVTWRTWLFDTLAVRSPGATTFLSSGDVLDRVIEDVDALQDLSVRLALPLLTAVVTGVVAAGATAAVLPIGGVILLVAVVASCSVAGLLGLQAARTERRGVAARGEVARRSTDLVLGLQDLVMAGGVDHAASLLEAAEEQRRAVARRRDDLRGTGTMLLGIVTGGTILAIALLAAHAHRAGSLTTGEVAAVVLVSVAGTEPLLGLLAAALRAPEVATSAERLDAIEDLRIPVEDPDHAASLSSEPLTLELTNVTAAPSPGASAVLEHLDLMLPAGSSVAILGSSGAGKSTLCRVLLRFTDLSAGRYTINMTDATSVIGNQLRQRIAMLDQSPTLFRGTLRDCLLLGDPAASDDALLTVLARCELEELAATPTDLARPIAEDGATLSGGQQRRLALARALLRQPEVLILDEPTAGLDDEQAASVLAACRGAVGSATVLLVTHEVDLTEGFDQVLWLENGRLLPLSNAQVAALR